jgi:hypothetical protein
MRIETWKWLPDELNILLQMLDGALPEEVVRNAREEIDAGEWGVPFETITNMLEEYDIAITQAIYDQIIRINDVLKSDRVDLPRLHALIQTEW